MTRSSAHKTRLVVYLWQHLPWTLLFWSTIVFLFGTAAAFAVGVEMRHWKLRHSDRVLDLKDGDLVRVVVVLNGDEVIVEKDRGRATVRMLGIRAFDPVVNEFEITAFGRAATSFLDQWALNRDVRITFDTPIRDARGRYLAYFERDGVDLNRRMVEEGIAPVYTEFRFAREAEYLSSEVLARAAGRGIWGGQRTRKRIYALRRDWDEARHERDGVGSADPYILEER